MGPWTFAMTVPPRPNTIHTHTSKNWIFFLCVWNTEAIIIKWIHFSFSVSFIFKSKQKNFVFLLCVVGLRKRRKTGASWHLKRCAHLRDLPLNNNKKKTLKWMLRRAWRSELLNWWDDLLPPSSGCWREGGAAVMLRCGSVKIFKKIWFFFKIKFTKNWGVWWYSFHRHI